MSFMFLSDINSTFDCLVMQYPTVNTRIDSPDFSLEAVEDHFKSVKVARSEHVRQEVASAILATSRVDAATALIFMCCGKAKSELGITRQLVKIAQVADVVLFDKVSPAERVVKWAESFPNIRIRSCCDFIDLRKRCVELSLQGKNLNFVGFNPWLNFDNEEELGHFTSFTLFMERQVQIGRCSPRMFIAKLVPLEVMCNSLNIEQGDVHFCSIIPCRYCGDLAVILAFLWQSWSEWRKTWQMCHVRDTQLFE